MVKKPKQPAETAELKKQIDTIVGHEIDPGGEPIIKFSSPAGSYTFFGEVVPQVSHSLLEAYLSVSEQGLFSWCRTSRSNRRFIYPGGWQASVSRERCYMPPGRILWFCGTHQCRCHAPCREPNLPHHDLLADTAGSGSVNSP